jgi:hypothetical protein
MDEYTEELDTSTNQEEESQEDSGQDFDEGIEEQPDVDAIKAELEETRQKLERATADKNGLLKKLDRQKPQTQSADNDRLDSLELRILDKDLTSDQAREVLNYKKATGKSLEEAYKSPVMQAFLKAEREVAEQERKIKESTPKANNKGTISSKNTMHQKPDSLEDWGKYLEDTVLKK